MPNPFPRAPASQEGFEDDFEYVHSSGALMSRRQLSDWFTSEGYACCAGGSKAAAGGGEAAPAPGTAGLSLGAGTGAGSESGGSGRLAMWVDRYSERQLAPGLWLVRWMELYQPFAGEARLRLPRLLCLLGRGLSRARFPHFMRRIGIAFWVCVRCGVGGLGVH